MGDTGQLAEKGVGTALAIRPQKASQRRSCPPQESARGKTHKAQCEYEVTMSSLWHKTYLVIASLRYFQVHTSILHSQAGILYEVIMAEKNQVCFLIVVVLL